MFRVIILCLLFALTGCEKEAKKPSPLIQQCIDAGYAENISEKDCKEALDSLKKGINFDPSTAPTP